MTSQRLKNRHPLRKKEAKRLLEHLSEIFCCEKTLEGIVEEARLPETREKVYVVGGVVVAFKTPDGEVVPTLRFLLSANPTCRFLTVDMGAVPHISRGADVMAPGVVDADLDIKEGDLLWVRDEKHHRPIAVCIALVDGETILSSTSGRVASTIHHAGDVFWTAEP